MELVSFQKGKKFNIQEFNKQLRGKKVVLFNPNMNEKIEVNVQNRCFVSNVPISWLEDADDTLRIEVDFNGQKQNVQVHFIESQFIIEVTNNCGIIISVVPSLVGEQLMVFPIIEDEDNLPGKYYHVGANCKIEVPQSQFNLWGVEFLRVFHGHYHEIVDLSK